MQLIKALLVVVAASSGVMAAIGKDVVEQVVYDALCDCTVTTTYAVSNGLSLSPTTYGVSVPTTTSTSCSSSITYPAGPIPTLSTTTTTPIIFTTSVPTLSTTTTTSSIFTTSVPTPAGGAGGSGGNGNTTIISPPVVGSVTSGVPGPSVTAPNTHSAGGPTTVTGSASHSSGVAPSVSISSTTIGGGSSTSFPAAPPTSTASAAGAAHATAYFGLLGAAAVALAI